MSDKKLRLKVKYKIKKSTLKKAVKIALILAALWIITYLITSFITDYKEKRAAETVAQVNEYCSTTWQDYVNTEVAPLMSSFIANNCTCSYEGNYIESDDYQSLCICSCHLYYLNGTLITDDFRPLFSSLI